MKKLYLLIILNICAFLGISLVSCTDEPMQDETSASLDETTSIPEGTTDGRDYGTLSIDDVFAWVGYPDNYVIPIFSNPECGEALEYEYDSEGIAIDPATNSVTALKAGRYEVVARSEHFSAEFVVRAEEVDTSDAKFSAKDFAGFADDRLAQWKQSGNAGRTTLFIGDSFFDTAFWSDFYSTYADRDALCLGISATTTYDWEEWVTGFLAATAPKNIVMHIGTNNVYDDGDTIFGALSAYQRMFLLMHEVFPDTHIYWFGVSQRSYDAEKIGYVSEINARMKKWCDGLDFITYIDTPSLLTKDMLRDGVHPKIECYSVFVDALAGTDIVIEDTK